MSSDGRSGRGNPRRPGRTDNTAGVRKVRTKRYHHGDLRATLLRTVGEIIAERGVAEVSLREVARRAQVSHGAPAHHFRNKAALVTAFAAQGFDQMVAAVEQLPAYGEARSGPEELAGTGRGYVRFALAHPAHFAIMFDSAELDGSDPAYREASNRAYALLTRAIERCVREGRLRPSEVGPATVASWSLVHGFASLWIGGRLGHRSGTATDATHATHGGRAGPSAAALALADAAIDLFVDRLVGMM
jgi:AcrR family transcriptional regulator